ncbi:IF-2-associated domain-containing protein, partial [Phenylobacterium terrae]|uniref:IF-2-associated domain-containing protein n=1 Tax=Phenylobacterium terrae TaxID=2665495 RepID=UPI00361DF42B
MSDENNNGRSGGRPPLTLKPRGAGSVSAGTVKQSFSHGRSKTVVVETKRPRTHAPQGGNLAGPSAAERRVFEPGRPAPSGPQGGAPRTPAGDGSGLSAEEQRARQRAIELAREQQARQAAERKAREERARAEAQAAAAEARR